MAIGKRDGFSTHDREVIAMLDDHVIPAWRHLNAVADGPLGLLCVGGAKDQAADDPAVQLSKVTSEAGLKQSAKRDLFG